MRKRRDKNQGEIVQGLEGLGWSVLDLADVGGGCPDILVGVADRVNVLLEIKNPKADNRRLRDKQRRFFVGWKGPIGKVETLEEAIAVVQGYL